MKKGLIIVVLLLIIPVGVGYLLRKGVPVQLAKPKVQEGEVVVRMVQDGFSPSLLYIRAGTKVRFTNEDTVGHWPASDLHPSHTLYPEFDPKHPVRPKEEWDFTFTRVGEWGMHDHLAPYIEGKIIVVS